MVVNYPIQLIHDQLEASLEAAGNLCIHPLVVLSEVLLHGSRRRSIGRVAATCGHLFEESIIISESRRRLLLCHFTIILIPGLRMFYLFYIKSFKMLVRIQQNLILKLYLI